MVARDGRYDGPIFRPTEHAKRETERVVKPSNCWHCISGNHEACDGGAWDIELKPVPCVCAMEDHTQPRWGGSAVIVGGWDDLESDRQGAAVEDRHWNGRGGDAA